MPAPCRILQGMAEAWEAERPEEDQEGCGRAALGRQRLPRRPIPLDTKLSATRGTGQPWRRRDPAQPAAGLRRGEGPAEAQATGWAQSGRLLRTHRPQPPSLTALPADRLGNASAGQRARAQSSHRGALARRGPVLALSERQTLLAPASHRSPANGVQQPPSWSHAPSSLLSRTPSACSHFCSHVHFCTL